MNDLERKEYHKKWRKENKDKLLTYKAKYREENRDKINEYQNNKNRDIKRRYDNGKQRAKTRNLDFDLSISEFENIVSMPCYYCNNLLGTKTIVGIGLDRCNNNKGYTIDNVVSCCKFCNEIKSDKLSKEEALAVIGLIIKIRNLKE